MIEKTIRVKIKGGKAAVEETISIIKSISGASVTEVTRKIVHEFDPDCPFCQLERKAK